MIELPLFTKGPWHLDKYKNLKAPQGTGVENAVLFQQLSCAMYHDIEAEANVRLIVKAPEMYNLLQKLITDGPFDGWEQEAQEIIQQVNTITPEAY